MTIGIYGRKERDGGEMEMRKMVVCPFFRNKQGGIKATRVILIVEKR